MKLEDMSAKDLLALQIADKPAGPKTFAPRAKLTERIRFIAKAKKLDLGSFGQPQKTKAEDADSVPSNDAAEA